MPHQVGLRGYAQCYCEHVDKTSSFISHIFFDRVLHLYLQQSYVFGSKRPEDGQYKLSKKFQSKFESFAVKEKSQTEITSIASVNYQ